MKLLKNFIIILSTGLVCCLFPFGTIGVLFGFIPVLLNTIILCLLFKLEHLEQLLLSSTESLIIGDKK